MSFENIETELANLTQTEVITLLQMLFTNMNNLDKTYYDMFYNITPMTINLERYDENGVLQTYSIPNRASDKVGITIGSGDPNGVETGERGAFYIDSTAGDLYFKNSDSGTDSWVKLRSDLNFQAGTSYLAPNGNGGQLTNLNASNVTGGTLAAARGGSGNDSYTAGNLLKVVNTAGIGETPVYKFVSAIPDSSYNGLSDPQVVVTDYIRPQDLVGQVSFFALDNPPAGWLVCNGSTIAQAEYPRLWSAIGTHFNTGSEASGMFRLPDLRGYFLRGWDNGRGIDSGRANYSFQNPGVPQHTHGYGTLYTESAGSHTHDRGTWDIEGNVGLVHRNLTNNGAFSKGSNANWNASGSDWNFAAQGTFKASRNWTGTMGSAGSHSHDVRGNTGNASDARYQNISEVRPYNIALLPCIKY